MAKKLFLVLAATSIQGINYACGSVVNIEKSVGDDYARQGQMDGTPAAVKHYHDNGAEVIEHVPADAAADAAANAEQIAALEDALAKAADADKPALQAQLAALKAE